MQKLLSAGKKVFFFVERNKFSLPRPGVEFMNQPLLEIAVLLVQTSHSSLNLHAEVERWVKPQYTLTQTLRLVQGQRLRLVFRRVVHSRVDKWLVWTLSRYFRGNYGRKLPFASTPSLRAERAFRFGFSSSFSFNLICINLIFRFSITASSFSGGFYGFVSWWKLLPSHGMFFSFLLRLPSLWRIIKWKFMSLYTVFSVLQIQGEVSDNFKSNWSLWLIFELSRHRGKWHRYKTRLIWWSDEIIRGNVIIPLPPRWQTASIEVVERRKIVEHK
jgi:hypothetical protein